MKLIDTNYDDILNAEYELYSVKLSELKSMVTSWYKNYSLTEFDIRNDYSNKDHNNVYETKLSGLVSNHIYAYLEDGEYYLMDGYNRILSNIGELDIDPLVYIKIITEKCSDSKLMGIMLRLNMWKLSYKRYMGVFDTNLFLDRGFRLFLAKKFKIKLDAANDYQNRKRKNSDFDVLNHYFRNESEMSHDFSYPLYGLVRLFLNEHIVEDFKNIVNSNDYLEMSFAHYDTFLEGFARFLSRERLRGNKSEIKFNDYVEKLKNDKFFKKLIKMSNTDSTRKNVFKFFNQFESIKKKEDKPIDYKNLRV